MARCGWAKMLASRDEMCSSRRTYVIGLTRDTRHESDKSRVRVFVAIVSRKLSLGLEEKKLYIFFEKTLAQNCWKSPDVFSRTPISVPRAFAPLLKSSAVAFNAESAGWRDIEAW